MKRIEDASNRVPVPLVTAHREGDGMMLRRPRGSRMGRGFLRLFGLKTTLTVHLDPLGSDVWRHMDGQRTVADILHALEASRPDERDLAARLGLYLSQLVSARLIRLR